MKRKITAMMALPVAIMGLAIMLIMHFLVRDALADNPEQFENIYDLIKTIVIVFIVLSAVLAPIIANSIVKAIEAGTMAVKHMLAR